MLGYLLMLVTCFRGVTGVSGSDLMVRFQDYGGQPTIGTCERSPGEAKRGS